MTSTPIRFAPWAAARLRPATAIAAWIPLIVSCGGGSGSPTAPAVSVETIGGVEFRHHFTDAAGIRWHWVDAGAGDTVVFIHGLPESWYSWHLQMQDLAAHRRVLAIDLKGYGQTDKPASGYSVEQVAGELGELLERIVPGRFDLVTHDWGTGIGQRLAADDPERIRRYARMEAPVGRIDLETRHPQFALFQDQEVATRVLGNATGLVRLIYGGDGRPGSNTRTPIPDPILDRIAEEFGRPGTAAAVARYFVENPILDPAYWERATELFARMDFPVLLLQADADPNQPREYFDDAESYFPDARLVFVPEAGHFLQLEQPAAVNAILRDFFGVRP